MSADFGGTGERKARLALRKARTYPRALVALLLPAGALLVASGANHWEKTFDSIPNPRISILNPSGGSVTIRGWDRPRVHAVCVTASAKVEIDCEQMPAGGEAEKVHFVSHTIDSGAAPSERAVNYELDVPQGSNLDINNPEGSITVEGIAGDNWLESVSGRISVTDASGRVSARSLNGDIDLVRTSGRVEANTVMGNLTFSASTSPTIRAQTVSGRILFDGDFVPAGEYDLTSYRGDMDIMCPASDSFELRARTVRGKVDDQLRMIRKTYHGYPGGDALLGIHNQGNATVVVESYSGTIHVRPRN